jgi:hypothetical protein
MFSREIWAAFVWATLLTTLYLCVDRVSIAIEREKATCPGPLEAGDYYTPEE